MKAMEIDFHESDSESSESNENIENSSNSSENSEQNDNSISSPEPEAVPLEELSESEVDENTVPKQRITINNKVSIVLLYSIFHLYSSTHLVSINFIDKSALRKNHGKIKLDVPWIEALSIISSEPVIINDVSNDMERELTLLV